MFQSLLLCLLLLAPVVLAGIMNVCKTATADLSLNILYGTGQTRTIKLCAKSKKYFDFSGLSIGENYWEFFSSYNPCGPGYTDEYAYFYSGSFDSHPGMFEGMKFKAIRVNTASTGKTLETGTFKYLENTLEYLVLYKSTYRLIETRVFSSLRKLKTLSISYNSYLTEIKWGNGTLEGLRQLEHIDLSYNKLKFLPTGEFSGHVLPALKYLYFRGNPIQAINSHTFTNLDLASHIYFDSVSKIQRILTKAFMNVSTGTGMNIEILDNPIRTIESQAFVNINSTYLSIRSPYLVALPEKALENVTLSSYLTFYKSSQLSWIHERAFHNVDTTSVSLSSTRLEGNLPPFFRGLTTPRIYMHTSQLTTIPFGFFFYHSNTIFQLYSNPLNCDCELVYLRAHKHQIESSVPKCSTGANALTYNFDREQCASEFALPWWIHHELKK